MPVIIEIFNHSTRYTSSYRPAATIHDWIQVCGRRRKSTWRKKGFVRFVIKTHRRTTEAECKQKCFETFATTVITIIITDICLLQHPPSWFIRKVFISWTNKNYCSENYGYEYIRVVVNITHCHYYYYYCCRSVGYYCAPLRLCAICVYITIE